MAHLVTAPATIALDAQVTIHSFGHDYTGRVVELAPRTCKVTYTNKGGTTYTLQVKRTDVAAPTATQKAGTERAKQTKRLRNKVRFAKNTYDYAATRALETLETINARRAEGREVEQRYGWTPREHNVDMTPERYEVERADRIEHALVCKREWEKAQRELEAHEATK